jgi:hypothetical protein
MWNLKHRNGLQERRLAQTSWNFLGTQCHRSAS